MRKVSCYSSVVRFVSIIVVVAVSYLAAQLFPVGRGLFAAVCRSKRGLEEEIEEPRRPALDVPLSLPGRVRHSDINRVRVEEQGVQLMFVMKIG